MKSRKRKKRGRPDRVFVNSNWWKLAWAKDPRVGDDCVMGACCPDLKTITIDEELEGIELVNTLLHEMLHAAFPMPHEEAVTTTADDLADVLAACKLIREG